MNFIFCWKLTGLHPCLFLVVSSYSCLSFVISFDLFPVSCFDNLPAVTSAQFHPFFFPYPPFCIFPLSHGSFLFLLQLQPVVFFKSIIWPTIVILRVKAEKEESETGLEGKRYMMWMGGEEGWRWQGGLIVSLEDKAILQILEVEQESVWYWPKIWGNGLRRDEKGK